MTEPAVTSFRDLKLPEPLLKALESVGYETPSPIQSQAIPPLLEGHDLLLELRVVQVGVAVGRLVLAVNGRQALSQPADVLAAHAGSDRFVDTVSSNEYRRFIARMGKNRGAEQAGNNKECCRSNIHGGRLL